MSTELVLEPMSTQKTSGSEQIHAGTTILPVAGGKGGTGKSTLTANLGVGLSLLGHRVILVDGDWGGADLHLFFNQIAPARSMSHFLTKEVKSLKEIVLPTPLPDLRLICGGNEMIGLANLPYGVKEKIVWHIGMLEADYVLIDLGAGTSFNTLDFFMLSNEGIIVCNPEPHSRVDAYGFLKNIVYRKLRRKFNKVEDVRSVIENFARGAGRKNGRISELIESIMAVDAMSGDLAHETLVNIRPKLLLNRVRNRAQIEERHRFMGIVKDFLCLELDYIGHIRSDSRVLDACERRRPVLIDAPTAPASKDIYSVLLDGMKLGSMGGEPVENKADQLVRRAESQAGCW